MIINVSQTEAKYGQFVDCDRLDCADNEYDEFHVHCFKLDKMCASFHFKSSIKLYITDMGKTVDVIEWSPKNASGSSRK